MRNVSSAWLDRARRRLDALDPLVPHPLPGTVIGVALVAALIPLLHVAGGSSGSLGPSIPLFFLVPVLLASAIGGRRAGVVVSCLAIFAWDWYWYWYFIPPFKGTLVVAHVEPDQGVRRAQTVEDERRLRATLQLADELGAEVVHLRGRVVDELIAYACAHNVTQIVIGHPTHGRWYELVHGSVARELLRTLQGIDIHVYAGKEHGKD